VRENRRGGGGGEREKKPDNDDRPALTPPPRKKKTSQPPPTHTHKQHRYPVLNRPYAFLQWIQQADIPERYILMSEPDHLFLRPLPNLAPSAAVPAAFPFFYIEPHRDEYLPLAARFAQVPDSVKTGRRRNLTRKEAMKIAPIGNSPTFLSTALARQVIPEWQRLSVAIFRDREANKAWGWVQEMYAFTIALYNLGVRRTVLAPELAAQPPWDTSERSGRDGAGPPFFMTHYTYGCDYALNGTHMRGAFGEWRFDKRTYAAKPPPRNLGMPPRGMSNPLVRNLILNLNEATDAIPCWDAYRAIGGKFVSECGGGEDQRAKGVWVGVEERRVAKAGRRRGGRNGGAGGEKNAA
jgi:hydroxyproline O-arabinosyltransferase